jgi:hypothetical protein
MQERDILNALDAVTLNNFSDSEKSIIFAHILSEKGNIKTAGNLNKIVLEKVADYAKGSYQESGTTAKSFQDFSGGGAYPEPFSIVNKTAIDQFLDKMMGKEEWDGDYFDDTFEFYHPKENMQAKGVPQHRSDFNTVTSNQ